MQTLANRPTTWVRAKIVTGNLARPPVHADARVAVVTQKNERIGFVVPQQNIVLGLVLLDQVVLEDQRLRLGMRDGKLDGANMAHQGPGLLAARIAAKIGTQTFGEIFGLADVQDAARLIQHSIHTRLVWHSR